MKPTKEKYILLLLVIFVAMPMWGQKDSPAISEYTTYKDYKEKGDFDIGKIRYTPIAGTDDEVEVKNKYWWSFDIGGNAYSGNITIPDTVSYLGKTYRVTAIGERAFSNSRITSVNIPNSVTDIGKRAFSFCENIEKIKLPISLKTINELAFWDCKKLKSVILPDSLQSIGSYAFDGCDSINVITLSANVKHIGKYIVPYGKISISPDNPYYTLDSGILYNKDKTILYDAYRSKIGGGFIIPETVKTIADNAFQNCGKISSVLIPSTVNSIGKSAFSGCRELKSVILPDSITEIASETFYDCKNLANISIPKQVINIGCLAFERTAWLAAQTDTMVYINNVLYHCNVPNAKIIEKDNEAILSEDEADKATRQKIEIREGTTSITVEAFDSWCNIGSLSIPSSVKRIGDDVLQVLALTELNVFWNDPSLVSITNQFTEEPVTTETWVTEKCTLIVPKGTKAKYKRNKVWGKFKIKVRKK